MLEFRRQGADKAYLKGLVKDAVGGMDGALEAVEKTDRKRYIKNVDDTKHWRGRFTELT